MWILQKNKTSSVIRTFLKIRDLHSKHLLAPRCLRSAEADAFSTLSRTYTACSDSQTFHAASHRLRHCAESKACVLPVKSRRGSWCLRGVLFALGRLVEAKLRAESKSRRLRDTTAQCEASLPSQINATVKSLH